MQDKCSSSDVVKVSVQGVQFVSLAHTNGDLPSCFVKGCNFVIYCFKQEILYVLEIWQQQMLVNQK